MRTQAIVIKTQPTNEQDLLVTCYTPELGKLTAVAKSALKHGSVQGMHLATLSFVDFELIEGRSMPIIAAAQSEKMYVGIKSSLPRLAMAQFFLEVMDKMVFDRQRDTALWEFLADTLGQLDEMPSENDWRWFRGRQLQLMHVLGYASQVEQCVRCGAWESSAGWAFSVELGGMICSACFVGGARAVLISSRELALLRGEESGEAASRGGRSAIDTLFEYHSGASFASLKFLYDLSGLPSRITSGTATSKQNRL